MDSSIKPAKFNTLASQREHWEIYGPEGHQCVFCMRPASVEVGSFKGPILICWKCCHTHLPEIMAQGMPSDMKKSEVNYYWRWAVRVFKKALLEKTNK